MRTKKEVQDYLEQEKAVLEEYDSAGQLSTEDYAEITKGIEILEWVLNE